MKINSFGPRVVKALSVAVVALVFFVSNPLTSLANGDNNKKSGLTDGQVSVTYVGADNNSVVFHVEFENPAAEKFWLIIKNDAGDVVYRKQFSDVHFAKSVFFQKEEADIHPTFVIRSGENEIVRQFAVTRTVTENTVVTKL